MQEVISEVLNIIIGNSLKELVEDEMLVEIGTPKSINISDIPSTWVMQLSSDIGDITLHLYVNNIRRYIWLEY